MFVCEDCLREKYTQQPGYFRSHGPCESCDMMGDCSDIPSKYLTYKDSYARSAFTVDVYERMKKAGVIQPGT